MKIFNVGDIFRGKSHGDMINETLGTNYADKIIFSHVDLGQFSAYGVRAWFVFMDGTPHGYGDGWFWENRLSFDGKTINEINVSRDKDALKKYQQLNGFTPFKLAFQKDPYESGNPHCCKFVGAFRLAGFYNKDLTAFKYEKVSDTFHLGDKGEYGDILDDASMFIEKNEKYLTPIENLGFSNIVLTMLQNVGIKYFWELLPIGTKSSGPIYEEIRLKLYETLKVD